jgi:hypothetical protein
VAGDNHVIHRVAQTRSLESDPRDHDARQAACLAGGQKRQQVLGANVSLQQSAGWTSGGGTDLGRRAIETTRRRRLLGI